MSSNPSALGTGHGGEPAVEIRRSLPTYGAANDMDTVPVDPSAAAAAPAPHSVNSVNEPLPAATAQANGRAAGTGFFRRRKVDKTPLLHSDSMADVNGTSSLAPITNPNGLSTFAGVFAPVALSMFSVLLFLRLGFVLGQSGLGLTLLQLAIAYGIVLLTVLSLCAISTNGALESGGVYYMISRALGPEFGGSIGVLFFFANVFSCALYIAGFTEVLVNNFGPNGYMLSADSDGILPVNAGWKFLYGALALLAILLVLLIGVAAFAKVSVAFLVLLGLCYGTFIASCLFEGVKAIRIPEENELVYKWKDDNGSWHTYNTTQTREFTGPSAATFAGNTELNGTFTTDYTTGSSVTFATVFAIVFSGVTGIMAGANMSGELKQPSVSIPKGTLQAVGVTFAVYVLTTFMLSWTCTRDLLQNTMVVAQEITFWPIVIVAGTLVTTFYAAMSNLIGASRVMLRLAEDRIFGDITFPFSITIGNKNPIFSVLLAWVLVVAMLAIGSLNRIAKIASIFFLLSYMGVNLACLALDLASAPNFRPRFKLFSWHTSLLGAAFSVAMCFFISQFMTGIALILLLLLLMLLHYKAPAASWGSISQALIFHQVRKYLLLLDVRKEHIKYWRPQMLLMVKAPRTCAPLIDFVNDLKKSGLYVIGHVRRGNLSAHPVDPLHELHLFWLSLVDYLKVKAFVELTLAESVRAGAAQLARLAGLGAMKPNTVVMGFLDDTQVENTLDQSKLMKKLKFAKLERQEVVEYFTAKDFPPTPSSSKDAMNSEDEKLKLEEYVPILIDVLKLNKNLVVARHFHKFNKAETFQQSSRTPQYIDVWPVDLVRPTETSLGWDTSCLFVLQLACILNMSAGWRSHTALRVFLCVNSLQDMQRRERQLRDVLSQLRIKARSLVVPWDHVVCHLAKQDDGDEVQLPRDAADLPHAYVAALNDMIKRHSAASAVVFVNLPPPPAQEDRHERYMGSLRELTDGLPPTLLVHGLSSVISTAL